MQGSVKDREIQITIYGDFQITLVPMKKLFIAFELENPKQTGYIEIGESKLPIYNNYFLPFMKGLFIPVWMYYFVGKPTKYDEELEALMYGMYQKWFESVKRNKKDNPKITNIKIFRSDKNDLLSFNIAYWTAVFLKVKKDIVERTIGRAFPDFWKTAGKDYGYLMKLSGYSIYPLRYYINLLANKIFSEDLLVYNLITLTKRQYPPLITIPNYPLGLPYLPPLNIKETPGHDYDVFELSLNLFENLTLSRLEKDEELYKRIVRELMGNTYYHTTFIRMKTFNVLSTLNPYHAKKVLLWDNGAYKVIDYLQIKKYEKPESFYTFKKTYINNFLKPYFEHGKIPYDKNGYLDMIKDTYGNRYIVINGTVIDVWSNGGVVLELGAGNEYSREPKTVVIPGELLTTVRLNVFSNIYETYPAVQVGKFKILINDKFTNPLSYTMIGTWARAVKRNKSK